MFAHFDLKSFKHDGSSHRMWRSLALIKENKEFWYLAAVRTKVVEDDGREWRTQQPTLYILSKDRFYNVICMMKGPQTVDYYINLASPTVRLSSDVLGFIDYDLDLKKSNGSVRELDLNEYQINSDKYNYSPKLRRVVEMTFQNLHQALLLGTEPFTDEENLRLYDDFSQSLRHKFIF